MKFMVASIERNFLNIRGNSDKLQQECQTTGTHRYQVWHPQTFWLAPVIFMQIYKRIKFLCREFNKTSINFKTLLCKLRFVHPVVTHILERRSRNVGLLAVQQPHAAASMRGLMNTTFLLRASSWRTVTAKHRKTFSVGEYIIKICYDVRNNYLKTSVTKVRLPNGCSNCHVAQIPARRKKSGQ